MKSVVEVQVRNGCLGKGSHIAGKMGMEKGRYLKKKYVQVELIGIGDRLDEGRRESNAWVSVLAIGSLGLRGERKRVQLCYLGIQITKFV